MKTKVQNFSLKHTIESGQFFAYLKKGDEYTIIQRQALFKIKQQGNNLNYSGISKNALFKFLGINRL